VLFFCPGKSTPHTKDATFEPVLAERATEAVANACLDPSLRDLAYTVYYADETTADEVVMEARTLPFLAERRVVLVRHAEAYLKAESRLAPLMAYLEEPSESTVLMLVAASIDRRTRFFKLCEKAGAVVECPQLVDKEVEEYIRSEAAQRGKRIEHSAVKHIFERAGKRLGDVNNALAVVATYVGNEEVIRESDVLAACADVAEEEVWTLTDAIAASDTARALEALRRLLDLGKHPDEIMGTINWLLKSAYTAVIPGSGQRLSRFVANKVTPLGEKLGREKLRDAFALCTSTQFLMRSTGVNPELALELLVVKLAAPRRRPAGAAR
jgi:DNA polymerase-3 subunit delta